MIKIGLIGFGKMGKIRFEELKVLNNCHIVKIYDPLYIKNKDKLFCSKAEEIYNSKDIDAVFISAPNYKNKQLTINCLLNDKHVFCEKPPALNSIELKEVIQVENKSDKVLMYGFNHRQHGSIKLAKEAVDSGEFGKVLWMRGRYGKSVDKEFFNNWRSEKKYSGGGILLDQGIHMLDLLLYFGDDYDIVQSIVSNLFWKIKGIEDNVFANLKNSKTGIVASIHSTMTQWRHLFSLEIFLERGHIVINGLKTSSNTYGEEKVVIEKNKLAGPSVKWDTHNTKTFDVDNSWNVECREFINSIKNNSLPTFGTSKDALKVMKLIEKIYKSSD